MPTAVLTTMKLVVMKLDLRLEVAGSFPAAALSRTCCSACLLSEIHEIQLMCQLLNIEIHTCATITCSSREGYKNKDFFLYIETFSSASDFVDFVDYDN